MTQLTQNDINFLKSLLSSEGTRQRFCEVMEKFIEELKDIETLPLIEDKKLATALKDRLDTIKNLRIIINRIVILASGTEEPEKYKGI